jgi:hypothetical protein
MIGRFGKSLESAVRRVRPYLLPAYRAAYRAMVVRGLTERREGERIVCCDFSNPAMDAVGGRYSFGLVRDLIDAGYFPVFSVHRNTLSTFGTSALKSLLLHERLGVIRSLDDLDEPFYLITDDPTVSPPFAEKIVVVDYAWRICEKPDEIAFPFFVHPWIASTKAPSRSESRVARLFFGGNTEEGKYDSPVIRKTYGMLTRREMLAVATEVIPPASIHQPQNAAEWLASREFHPFVFCETQHCKIPPDRWLEALGRADFFLACPGVGMPLCHNLVEALAAGCVPILQYGAYLTPPLQDRVNCLAFHDAQSLNKVLNSIISMPDREISAFRTNVRAHYNAHLAPGRFAQRLFTGPHRRRVLLLNDYRVPR